MMEFGLVPDRATYAELLRACYMGHGDVATAHKACSLAP